ncbi:uncharacterized protein TRIVIDRAFT_70313 [Trichoderma virens Gv29-8]|uniref:Uncharacterized protein n=1 Tax=Hypocrea virens (strain Gv29-8 / FGSC 10586) TaxID=413071 RepID=G9MW36_HYPVG|nr:uncharacterized protein TRIVIDRAFT_70313 [Trichoderma virens Gv29-8]EHK21332.1 hypothetical protein TRIVIDRAFT_70313 [Trichoderma virens Gv29-8]UKZ47128.1 hypothetical protein TrVGV298_001342 [Trichoderma virens]
MSSLKNCRERNWLQVPRSGQLGIDVSEEERSDDEPAEVSLDDVRPTRNDAGLLLELQQFEHPFARLRSPSPTPPIRMTKLRQITRQEVLDQMSELVDKATLNKWDDETNAKLVATLTEQMVAVMPEEMKNRLKMLARQMDYESIQGWLEKAGDKTIEKWTEVDS